MSCSRTLQSCRPTPLNKRRGTWRATGGVPHGVSQCAGSLTSLSALKKGRGCALVWGRDNSLQPIAKKKRVGGREEEGSQSVSVQEYSRCQTALLVQRRWGRDGFVALVGVAVHSNM